MIVESRKVIYTAKLRTTGGREGGNSKSSDGRLDVAHSVPGGAGTGTNPEQLFAAAWSTCFESAMRTASRKMRIILPADLAIDAEVDLVVVDSAYEIQARLNVSLPGLSHDTAQAVVAAAHQTCPYSKATRGNIKTSINIV
jgi:lipoyl-dependent peroxiredoxin